MELRQGNIILNVDEVDAGTPEARTFYEGVITLAEHGNRTKKFIPLSKLLATMLMGSLMSEKERWSTDD